MREQDKANLLLDMQEHPENYTDEQLASMLADDEELAEMLEAAAKTKQAMTKAAVDNEELPMDELWEQFQMYVRETAYDRDERFFAFHRDPECIDIWRQMLDNMGGGFPLSLFAAAAFLLLTYRDRGA